MMMTTDKLKTSLEGVGIYHYFNSNVRQNKLGHSVQWMPIDANCSFGQTLKIKTKSSVIDMYPSRHLDTVHPQ